MAQSDRRVGKNAVLRWKDSGGGTTTLYPDVTKMSQKNEMKTADATAGNDTAEYNIGTYRVLGLDLDMYFNASLGTAAWAKLKTGTEGTVEFGIDGTAATKPKGAFGAIITNWDVETPFDDMITIKATFKPQGDWVSDPATAQW